MRRYMLLVAALSLWSACGDDKKSTTDTKDATSDADTHEVTPDTVEEATPDTVEPDTNVPDTAEPDTVEPDTAQPDTADTADTTPEETVADTSGDTTEPPSSFPTALIDLIENKTADDTDPVPFADFSSLDDDQSQDVFDSLFP